MNDRIRQLAVQAHLSWCIENDFDQENLQEFAELIVKECIKQAHNVANLRGVNDQMIYGADSAAVLISKLFKD